MPWKNTTSPGREKPEAIRLRQTINAEIFLDRRVSDHLNI